MAPLRDDDSENIAQGNNNLRDLLKGPGAAASGGGTSQGVAYNKLGGA